MIYRFNKWYIMLQNFDPNANKSIESNSSLENHSENPVVIPQQPGEIRGRSISMDAEQAPNLEHFVPKNDLPPPEAKPIKSSLVLGALSGVATRISNTIKGFFRSIGNFISRSDPAAPQRAEAIAIKEAHNQKLESLLVSLPSSFSWGPSEHPDETPDITLNRERQQAADGGMKQAAIQEKLNDENLPEADRADLKSELKELNRHNPAVEVDGVKGLVSQVSYVDSNRIQYQFQGGKPPEIPAGRTLEQTYTKAIFDDLANKIDQDPSSQNLNSDQKLEAAHLAFAAMNQSFEQPIFRAMSAIPGNKIDPLTI
jgi:hypothetical protein